MVFDDFFLSIPVYRLSETKYYSCMEKDFHDQLINTWDKNFIESNQNLVNVFENNHREEYGGDWEFNEIVGHIKLFFMGSQVRGEYWSTKPVKKVRTRKKVFEFKSHKIVAECEIRKMSNEGILSAVEDYLSRCEQHLKYRHLDLRQFDSLKSHLDWVSLWKLSSTIKV